MVSTASKSLTDGERVTRYADMFSAMGTEARLRIMQLLLSAHPEGLVVNEIQDELEIPGSTLSHHLDKLKNEDLVRVERKGTFLRYTANTEALREILQFLYAECCTRNNALKPKDLIQLCK
jgi:ArsR family transcriptional regulator, arsenate/arsenite/antimonite-responsive transcriptional repressor